MNQWLLRVARLTGSVWRFQSRQFGQKLFGTAPAPCIVSRSFFGQRLHLDVSRSDMQRVLFLEGERFLSEQRLLAPLLRPGQRVIDVGANIGYHALFFARSTGPTGSVICFEPERENLVELRRNVEANRLSNVQVVAAAVGDRCGRICLSVGINGHIEIMGDPADTYEVDLTTLDASCPQGADLLKIDVEGYEGHVLAGAERLLQDCRPTLFVEMHPFLPYPPHTTAATIARLRSLYPVIEVHEIPPGASLLAKALSRYTGIGRTAPVRNLEALLADCAAGRRSRPFWVIARGRPQASARTD